MKHIKEAIVTIMVLLVMLVPTPAYAETLQEALNAQLGIENTQEESSGYLVFLADIFQEQMEQELTEIRAEAERAKEEAIRAAERERLIKQAQPIEDATYTVPTTRAGYCAMWCSLVYQAAGFGYPGGNACDMYWKYCTSSNREDIIPGMLIAVPSHTGTSAGRRYGHIGIIVAHDGQYYVRHSSGSVKECTLDEWIETYGTTYEPKWGFAVDLGA